jgi:hypothetical protein
MSKIDTSGSEKRGAFPLPPFLSRKPAESSFNHFLESLFQANLLVEFLGAILEKLLNVLQVLKLLRIELDKKTSIVVQSNFHLLTSFLPFMEGRIFV